MTSQIPHGADPSTRPEHDPKVLDAAALERLRELDPEGRHGVIPRVLAAYESSLARMRTVLEVQLAAEVADRDTVNGIVHTLKSASASVGALAMSEACAELEQKLRPPVATVDRQDIEKLLSISATTLGTVRAMLQA